MALRPIQKVYKAFARAGLANESGLAKSAFLGLLQAHGVDLERVSVFALAKVLKGKLKIEDLLRL
jgi:ribosomal protein L12E/L44/L45/RPP1/RPP2